ncbi:MAG TPA: hypothetical protein DCX98_04725 [Eubacterium sp.]|jgi:hypothetical protein|nr:hypothetical protein [Eubacterium sp.]
MISEINNCELMDVKINKSDNRYYVLCLTYKYHDEYGNTHERVIDNVPLPLYNHLDNIIIKETYGSPLFGLYIPKTIDVGFGEQDVRPDFTYIDRIVEYATKEMTIEEIENKLGHKVKIVNKK